MSMNPHFRSRPVKAASMLFILIFTLTVVNKASLSFNPQEIPAKRLPAGPPDAGAEKKKEPLEAKQARETGPVARPEVSQPLVGPNLTPFRPTGWSDRIVVSNVTGNHTDSFPLNPTDTLFVDWAAINNGTSATPVRFHTRLFVDGFERATWFTDPPLGVDFFAFIDDFSIGTLSPGTHTLRIVADVFNEVVESSELDNEYTKTITVSSGGQPNLTPSTPPGWSDRIVVSNVSGNHVDSFPLTASDTLFVDWAVLNNGSAATTARFRIRLFVDGVEKATWFDDPPLPANVGVFVEDFSIGSLSPGAHTLRIVADVFNEIQESNEFDNEYSKTINISSAGQPNLTPFTPNGWSDRIVVSNVTGNHSDSPLLRPTDTLFVDWAVANNGTAATATRFHTKLFVDGVEKASWFTDPPLNADFFAFIEDFSIGSLSPGSHTLRIVADALNAIPESNEGDNEYSKTISVVASQTCHTVSMNVSPSNGGTTTRSPQGACALSQVSVDAPNFAFESISSAPTFTATGPRPGRAKRVADAFSSLISKAEAEGSVRVIVGLNAAFEPEGYLDGPQAVTSQRNGISRVQDDLIKRLVIPNAQSIKRFQTIPFIAMEVDAAGLRYLESSPDVISIEEDVASPPALAESLSIIGAPAAWASGFSGAGQTIAILDTGVDKNHPFLAGKVVSEACFSSSGISVTSLCPGGVLQSTSPGSGVNCFMSDCDHGTHVAGIAAGRGTTSSGVAKDANIIAIQVFSRFESATICGEGSAPCVLSRTSDQILGLERVLALSNSFNIAAANMSLGGGKNPSYCDADLPGLKAAIDNLRSRGIATIIASGNSGHTDGIGGPACISSAVSVGSTGDGSGDAIRDRVVDSSNSSSYLNLLAPGKWIFSSIPGGRFDEYSGTSMAAPHVAGAWAVLKSKASSATVDQVLAALTNTGVPITDTRNGIVKPRIQLDSALNAIGGGGGGGAAQYRSGTTVTMTATPNAGFVFEKWQRDGVDFSTSATINVVVSASSTMTAVFRAAASNAPRINTASFQSPKTMRIFGASFGQFPRVFINGIERSSFIISSSEASITLKGKSKKLGLRPGNNNVQVVTASGTGSNTYVLTL